DLLAGLQQAEGGTLFACLQRHRDNSSLLDETRLALARILPPLMTARRLRQTLPLAELLEKLWLELGGPSCLDNAGLLPTIESFFRLVAELAPHGTMIDVQALEEKLTSSRSSERDEGVKLQIMTIHKA